MSTAQRLAFLRVGLLALALGALGACDNKAPATSPGRAAPQANLLPAIATSGDARVAIERFEARVKQYGPNFGANQASLKFLAEAMLDEELLLKEAEKRGIDKDPVISRRLDDYRRQLLMSTLLEKLAPPTDNITKEQMGAYYEKNAALFHQPERIRVSRILLPSDKKALATQLVEKAKKGAPFAELAKEHSTDSASKDRGGDVGVYQKGSRPDLGDGPFGLKKAGDVGMFETPSGINVVQLVARFEAQDDKLDDAKVDQRIKMDIRRQAQEDARQSILKAAKAASPVKVDEAKLGELAKGSQPPQQPPPAPPSERAEAQPKK